jgi:hypothetical protein
MMIKLVVVVEGRIPCSLNSLLDNLLASFSLQLGGGVEFFGIPDPEARRIVEGHVTHKEAGGYSRQVVIRMAQKR